MSDKNMQSSNRRVLASMKHYLLLKVIDKYGGSNLYYSKIVDLLKGNITWAHANRLLREFSKNGIINTARNGRTMVVELTPKGREFLKHLEAIMELQNIEIPEI